MNTRKLIVEEGGFKYDSDSYADDLPYWTLDYGNGRPHLIIPYTLSENDMKFTSSSGMATGREFCEYLKDTLRYGKRCANLDVDDNLGEKARVPLLNLCLTPPFIHAALQRYLIEEGKAGSPKMMSVGLHCRLARPGRVHGLAEFLDFAKSYRRDVWFCTREQVADYWFENHFPKGAAQTLEKGAPPEEAVAKTGGGKNEGAEGKAEAAAAAAPTNGGEEEGDII